MAQAAVDFQKLLNLEQERHSQEKELEELEEITTTEIPFPLEKTMKELNQNIFLDDKAIKGYNNTKVKARNFLTNVSYNRITTADYKNKNFVIDCFTFYDIIFESFLFWKENLKQISKETLSMCYGHF